MYLRFLLYRLLYKHRDTPIKTPGITPPMNMAPTETPVATQYITMGMEGGMITPMEPAAAEIAPAKGLS